MRVTSAHRNSQLGASLLEYALLVAMISFAAIIGLQSTQQGIHRSFSDIYCSLGGGSTSTQEVGDSHDFGFDTNAVFQCDYSGRDPGS